MGKLSHLRFLLSITHSHLILRRYFVVNGFDGVLTMMGLIIGFIVSTPADLAVIINVCLGAAIALGMSGISSAYISESAERRHALDKLEGAMISDLQQSTHGQAARLAPLLVALVLTFFLGVFLGRISDVSLLRSGLQTLMVAVATAGLIYLFAGG